MTQLPQKHYFVSLPFFPYLLNTHHSFYHQSIIHLIAVRDEIKLDETLSDTEYQPTTS